tara:strand:+ start:148 stop:342 length:195 start_codon:yes stop_codon:yes gene_type:complete
MTISYEKNKKNIYAWREKNRDKLYSTNKKHIYKWREKNPDRLKVIEQKKYSWKKIKNEFLNILL